MGDANTNTTKKSFFNPKKRSRVNSEPETGTSTRTDDERLSSSDPITTNQEDSSSESNDTNMSENTDRLLLHVPLESTTQTTTPRILVNDNRNLSGRRNDSTETIITNHAYVERERENLAFRLDRLNDKQCRYESHELFLKKCLTNNLVPNGLKVFSNHLLETGTRSS